MEVTDNNFEKEVIQESEKIPVIVDFWAPWCGPCLILKPIIEDISKEMKGKVKIVKLNVEENPVIAEKFEIMSIPNVKMFKKGEIVAEFLGVRPKSFIVSWIEENL
ncbi:MAG: thioredoxin [Candidatus Pacearchaeota archaeon]